MKPDLKPPKDADLVMGKIDQAAKAIRQKTNLRPKLAIVLGSGLGALADAAENSVRIPYDQIPGFADSTVPGHSGTLVLGHWQGREVAILQGRFHYYEGHDIAEVVFPMRVLTRLGLSHVLLTNAAGGLDADMQPGDLMLIEDHLSFFLESPLRGTNLEAFGPRFVDQSHVYDPAWKRLALEVSQAEGVPLRRGVYAYSKGPQFETPAEIRALGKLGASAVGMSTVPEAIVAVHGGLRVLGLSCITNMAAGILDQPLSHEEVMETGARAADKTIRLLSALIRAMDLKEEDHA